MKRFLAISVITLAAATVAACADQYVANPQAGDYASRTTPTSWSEVPDQMLFIFGYQSSEESFTQGNNEFTRTPEQITTAPTSWSEVPDQMLFVFGYQSSEESFTEGNNEFTWTPEQIRIRNEAMAERDRILLGH